MSNPLVGPVVKVVPSTTYSLVLGAVSCNNVYSPRDWRDDRQNIPPKSWTCLHDTVSHVSKTFSSAQDLLSAHRTMRRIHSLITSDSFSASLKWQFSGQLVFTFPSLRSLHGINMELIFISREGDLNLTCAGLLHCLIASQRTMYIRRRMYKYPSIDHKLSSRELAYS